MQTDRGIIAVRAVVDCRWVNAAQVWAALDRAFPAGSLLPWEEAADQPEAALCDVGLIVLSRRPQEGALDRLGGLAVVHALGAGVDHLADIMRARPDLAFCRVVDPTTPEKMADYVLTAILRVFRQFDRYAAQQARREWRLIDMPAKADYPVTVLGLGRLGSVVAQRLAALGFTVRGWNRSDRRVDGVAVHCGQAGFGAALNGAAAVVNLLPLTDATQGILGADLIDRMAPGGHIVNVARGAHLDEAAVLAALDDGRLGRLTADVFAIEPLPRDHPFWSHPNVLITPHISSIIEPDHAAAQIAQTFERLRRGEPPLHRVDIDRGY